MNLRLLRCLGTALLLSSCGSWSRVGSQPQPDHSTTLTQALDLTAVFKRLGRLAAGAPVPFVGTVECLASPGDSVIAVVALSLANQSFSFSKEGQEFVAQYRVELAAEPDGGSPSLIKRDQTIRVRTFAETQRADESILFQEAFRLAPGHHRLSVTVRDKTTGNQSRAEGTFDAPAFSPGTLTTAILAYHARPRLSRTEPLSLVLNPRGTLAYGGDTTLAYVEAYGLQQPRAVPLVLRDVNDSVIVRDTLHFAGGKDIEGVLYRLAPDSAPLGELHLVLGDGPDAKTTTALVSFSQAWVVTNFDNMVGLLRYFPESPTLDSLRKAEPAQRAALWRSFYHESDPNPSTPQNEALSDYFARIGQANQRFRDESVAGWRTDRGEAWVRLGEPDQVYDQSPASEGRVIRWEYTEYRLILFFVDETGFGRYKLTPSSRADLERVVAQLGRKAG